MAATFVGNRPCMWPWGWQEPRMSGGSLHRMVSIELVRPAIAPSPAWSPTLSARSTPSEEAGDGRS